LYEFSFILERFLKKRYFFTYKICSPWQTIIGGESTMKKNNRVILFLVSVALVIAFIVGCAPARRQDETPQTPTKDTKPNDTTPNDTTPNDTTPNDTTPNDTTPKDTTTKETPGDMTDEDTRSEEAKKIADKVADLEEIESATCVITGDTAMVGVQFSEQYKGELTDEIKKKIEDVAEKSEEKITKVVVTADPDLYKRLEDIVTDIGKGKPLTGFRDEIDEILNRIQPK